MEPVNPKALAAEGEEALGSLSPEHNASRIRHERIVIVGKPGAGKTTLSKQLASRHNLARVELDAIFWQPNWVSLPREEMRERVDKALPAGGRWVADGNYMRSVGDIVWTRADTLVWLDYPLPLALARLTWRTVSRIARRSELWNGNRESLRHHLSSGLKENLFLWSIKAHKRHRREFPARFERPENHHLHVMHFRSPDETEQWLRNLQPAAREKIGEKA